MVGIFECAIAVASFRSPTTRAADPYRTIARSVVPLPRRSPSARLRNRVAKMEALLLPIPYFHTVFTTDHRINDLAYHNPEVIYNLLFETSSRVLKQFGKQYLGGEIGFSGIIHTSGQTLQPHIHVHFMVTGGALVPTSTGYEWRKSADDFLVPVVELAVEFRNAFCAGLLKLYKAKTLRLVGSCAELDVAALVQKMLATKWEVYACPRKDPETSGRNRLAHGLSGSLHAEDGHQQSAHCEA